VGDVIVSLNGEPIDRSQELTARLARLRPGDRVTLGIVRYGDRRTVEVTLDQFDEAQAQPAVAAADRPRAEELLG
ncbi:MAG: PDZ domain-containing protein, partial [Gemmatimonadetes bacterium]|nr:PDZ domain-containing protein [Gemmatimonadota bacterium]NIR35221.1 PDZ domain-containing protein [Actinomycetota bacterium]NIS29345.1 PDZ domain-containing protein [Actinomycetota bacterium]NIU64714.1 PDZ domain-containing protein [Actinomycetota bacterium]NIW26515.1 PDZ domain-containing protein [Actinomycetota bacterium]